MAVFDPRAHNWIVCRFSAEKFKCFNRLIYLVTKEQHIDAGANRASGGLFDAVVVGDCFHLQVVAEHDAVVAQLVA